MDNDIKLISALYESNAGINNTTRNTDSYTYLPTEYSVSREEQQENRTSVVQMLQKCVELGKVGRKDTYAQLLFVLRQIDNKITKILLTK